MKSLNAKRIASVAAGAALIGAAFAAAAPSVDSAGVGNYGWFSNGAPDVKVVLGSQSAPSDGVAAGNLAAMLGNLAYTARAITVTGLDGVSCTTSGGSGGSSSGRSVKLTISTPGVNPANAFLVKSLIEDNLDNNADSIRNTTSSFTPGWAGTSSLTVSSGNPRLISGGDTQILKNNAPISNPKGLNIKETESIYVFAAAQFDDPSDSIQAKNVRSQYKVSFSDSLPMCLDNTKPYTGCNEGDKVDRNRIQVNFLGDKWAVTGVTLDAGATATVPSSVSSLTLGKESAYSPTMKVGDALTAANGVKVTLQDVTATGFGAGNQAFASFKVETATGTSSVETLQAGDNKDIGGITIKVYKVFAGVGNTNYVEAAVYSDKLELTHNTQISGHGYWRATLAKVNQTNTEAIAEIGLHDLAQGGSSPGTLNAGEAQTLITNQPALLLRYNGIEDVDYDTLAFTADTSNRSIITDLGQVTGRFITLQSGNSDAFFRGNSANQTGTVLLLADGGNATAAAGAVFSLPNSGSTYVQSQTAANMNVSAALTTGLVYNYGPSDSAVIKTYNPSGNLSHAAAASTAHQATGNLFIFVPEITSDNLVNTQTSLRDGNSGMFVVQYEGGDAGTGAGTTSGRNQFVQDAASTTIDSMTYVFPSQPYTTNTTVTGAGSFKATYVSRRGSKFTGVSTSSASLSYAKRLAKAQYTVSIGGVGGVGNTASNTYSEGQTALDDNGYKVVVNEILAAGQGSGGACSVTGTDGVSASIATADSVTALNTAQSPLVWLDSQAGGVSKAVLIGGHEVNSATAGAGVSEYGASNSMVKVVNGKVVVAGSSAQDTTDAANALIQWLADNRATLTA
jgi:hypothetical protein